MKKKENWLWHYPEDLICIKEIPKAKDILSLKLRNDYPSSDIQLDKKLFLYALENTTTKILDPKNKLDLKMLSGYAYSSWSSIWISTKKGDYKIVLFLGGMSFITLPNGNKGAILFDFSK